MLLSWALISCSSNPPLKDMFTLNQEEISQLQLEYYSDYFSFVGEDSNGKVMFAIDNNRGQDGQTWQADHFLVLHDEQLGWQHIEGNGLYENKDAELKEIPDSQFFQFSGSAATGITLSSEVNEIKLSVEPIQTHWKNKKGLSQMTLGSSSAVLNWKGRKISGRVIHEFLYLPGFNRLSRKYFGVFKDFHGIYAMTENKGDFYFHSQKNKVLMPLIGEIVGFYFDGQLVTPIENPQLTIKGKEMTLGFYQWPNGWQGKTQSGLSFDIDLTERNSLANWVIGGFAMGVLNGEVKQNGKVIKLVGIGELII